MLKTEIAVKILKRNNFAIMILSYCIYVSKKWETVIKTSRIRARDRLVKLAELAKDEC